MATPEGKIQKAILDALTKAQVFHWRNNNAPIYDQKLNSGYGGYRAHAGMKGVPDIICVINGQFVGIEVKTPRGKQSSDQVLFQKRLERAGGKYILARGVDDIVEIL